MDITKPLEAYDEVLAVAKREGREPNTSDRMLAMRAAIEAHEAERPDDLLEQAAAIADKERAEFAEQAAHNNGRESDFAFGSVNSAERIAAAIRALKSPKEPDNG